ncbi:MAG: lytic transglycosylase domain-containing protein [Acidobacteria bacterium]|nr:lytic transglycosylase domain-containing protein [Acidobacteriota bacterium]
MMQSVALQEVSVRKQAPGPPPKFFLLPPPAATPGLVPYSATVAPFADCDPLPSAQIDAVVERAATAQSVDPDLLRSVIRQESAFRPCSVSVKGAVGLMQLMPATINQFSVSDPFDPMKNVDAGAKLLKQLLNKYSGDLARALAAYNAGTVPVDSAGAVPDIPETLNYVKKILSDLPAKKN